MESYQHPLTESLEIVFEPLQDRHSVAAFDCGVDSLNIFLHRHALHHPRQGLSRTWVFTCRGSDTVLGYFTLAWGSCTHASATKRAAKGMPRYDLPVLLLARLAVALDHQGQGLGEILLEQALKTAAQIARAAENPLSGALPFRAVAVRALDDKAARFYQHCGFECSPVDPLLLMISTKTLLKTIS